MIKLRLQQCLSHEKGIRGFDGQERGSRRKKGLAGKRWAVRDETMVGRPVGKGKLHGSTCSRSLLFYQVKSSDQVKEETSLLGVLLLFFLGLATELVIAGCCIQSTFHRMSQSDQGMAHCCCIEKQDTSKR